MELQPVLGAKPEASHELAMVNTRASGQRFEFQLTEQPSKAQLTAKRAQCITRKLATSGPRVGIG